MMSDDKILARRKLLKSLAAGSGALVAGKTLPDSWGRPVVDAVMLPAHAQTSLLNSSGPAALVNTVTERERPDSSLLAQASDLLLPDAHAQRVIPTAAVCVEHLREGGDAPDVANFSARLLFAIGDCKWSFLVTATNVPANPSVNTPTVETPQCVLLDGVGFNDSLGLLPAAQAGEDGLVGGWVNLHTLNGPSGGAFGFFYFDGFTFKFDLPRSDCQDLGPVCSECDF